MERGLFLSILAYSAKRKKATVLDGFIKFLLVKLLYHISMNFSTDLAFLCFQRYKF